MNKECNNQQEVPETAWRLAQAIHELMEEYAINLPEEISEQIVRLSNQVSQVERKQQQSLNDFTLAKQQLNNLTSTNTLLENAGKANQLLGQEHYKQHIIDPMVRSLFPVFDLIADFRKHHGDLNSQVMLAMDSIKSQLQQFLATYDIEIIEHATGDNYDTKIMASIKWEVTADKHLEKTVARSLQIGFRQGHSRVLRMETVSLFEYQSSKTNTNNFIEREENDKT